MCAGFAQFFPCMNSKHTETVSLIFLGPAEETGTRTYDITAGPSQHTPQQQEADCLQDEPRCWCVDGWLQKMAKGALL
jgi:hypothetical protein